MSFEDASLTDKLREFASEDIGFGDITTQSLIDQSLRAEAVIIGREKAVMAGARAIERLFTSSGCRVKIRIRDGDELRSDAIALSVTGLARVILQLERTALNILGRMSGIATETRRYVEKTRRISPKTRVAATRKTAPGLMRFDKEAVTIGGGDTHRFRLDDASIIKDNHLRIVGSIKEAVAKVKKQTSFTKKVEVETSSTPGAIQAAEAGADIVMLDNMSPSKIGNTISLLKKKRIRDRVLLEASGGINHRNLENYVKTGVDVVSIGALTHSVKSVNFSLQVIVQKTKARKKP